jgi:hypothetical protein
VGKSYTSDLFSLDLLWKLRAILISLHLALFQNYGHMSELFLGLYVKRNFYLNLQHGKFNSKQKWKSVLHWSNVSVGYNGIHRKTLTGENLSR